MIYQRKKRKTNVIVRKTEQHFDFDKANCRKSAVFTRKIRNFSSKKCNRKKV